MCEGVGGLCARGRPEQPLRLDLLLQEDRVQKGFRRGMANSKATDALQQIEQHNPSTQHPASLS